MPTDTIFFEDLTDNQFPYDEIAEMEAEDFGRAIACCNSIPCRFGGCEAN